MIIFNKKLARLIAVLLVAFLAGCATTQPYDYTALKASAPRSILVIPPLNESVEALAPYTYISTLSRPLGEKGYYVFPVAVIDAFLKENGLPTPAEMNNITLDKINEHIGPDAVLYTTIEEFGQKYIVASSYTVVTAQLKLVDARTGQTLWTQKAHFQREPGGSNNNGLVGMLISAIVSQVMASVVDYTPDVARTANYMAIYNKDSGLLDGPYRSETGK